MSKASQEQTAELARRVLAITYDCGVSERMVFVRLIEQGKITLGDIRDAVESY